jgi:DNA (cytosine-5)-methyltransferase 1
MSTIGISEAAKLLGVSKDTLRRWDNKGYLIAERQDHNQYRAYKQADLFQFEEAHLANLSTSHATHQSTPRRPYTSIELFAGAGGMALGLEKAGFHALMLNELDKQACQTLKNNRPNWNVVQADISSLDFQPYAQQIDLLAGGFPCQAFSYAGKKLGFEDTRGTLFFEFARAVKEIQPKVFLAENVRGLLNHEGGKTLETIREIITELGYSLVEPKVMRAIYHRVPQKRERLFLVGIRNDLVDQVQFHWPLPDSRIFTLKDALKAGSLFATDVPDSEGQKYPEKKRAIMEQVPPGGYWRDLPLETQKDYMKASFYLGGGKTGMARRLSWDEPSLTLTCAPAQKQTERCHPEETRPLKVREYARIQTFPDDWRFAGSVTSQYRQIGNAVPVNLGYAMGQALVNLLNQLEDLPEEQSAKTIHHPLTARPN